MLLERSLVKTHMITAGVTVVVGVFVIGVVVHDVDGFGVVLDVVVAVDVVDDVVVVTDVFYDIVFVVVVVNDISVTVTKFVEVVADEDVGPMLLWLWKCMGDVLSVVDVTGATVIVEDVFDGVAVVVHAVTVSTTGVVAGVDMLAEASVRLDTKLLFLPWKIVGENLLAAKTGDVVVVVVDVVVVDVVDVAGVVGMSDEVVLVADVSSGPELGEDVVDGAVVVAYVVVVSISAVVVAGVDMLAKISVRIKLEHRFHRLQYRLD
ncbi:unnamed protein product [Gongylonema pulchrum]|uniref:Uncharacterized protein n=1 Tax=Gongylonema pulchrum TaxID=637853 RepID=A0A183CWR9_9BILA|nr:unnamed protein product [Gongylonema pulchrum]